MNEKINKLTTKVITKRCGKIDPYSISDYTDNGGYRALKSIMRFLQQDVIAMIKASGLRGRGGAGFPTGVKLESVMESAEFPKYVICNADEGEPGNFKDRYLMEGDPHQILEGIIISAYAIGANKGFIYIRGEYDRPIEIMLKAIEDAYDRGYLGKSILGSGFDFDLEFCSGAGAYICGEEFALIESIEGKPGRPRRKPPYPPSCGLYDKPTLVNNVETFANIPHIISMGPKAYKALGTESSSGTRLVCLSGNVVNRGVYEVPFGITIKDIIFELGGGVPGGRRIKMVQLGGASGPCIPESMLDIRLDFMEFKQRGMSMGTGAVTVIDDRFGVLEIVKKNAEFFLNESCGKCTPCREGNFQIIHILNKLIEGTAVENDLKLLKTICNTMAETSFCGLGQVAPTSILSTMEYFEDEYTGRIKSQADLSRAV